MDDKHYCVVTDDTEVDLGRFLSYYCQEILRLKYDIILLYNHYFKGFQMKTYHGELERTAIVTHGYEHDVWFDSMEYKRIMEKHKYKHQRKFIKNHKSYLNNKRKFKYNRW